MEEEKKNMSELITSTMEGKLTKLDERIKENPPKTQIGKRIVMARLNMLDSIVKIRLDRSIVKNANNVEKFEVYDKYDSMDKKLAAQITNLSREAEKVMREIRRLREKYDPQKVFKDDEERKAKLRPKGYMPKEQKEDSQAKTALDKEQEMLEARLKELDLRIQELREQKEGNLSEMEEEMKGIETKGKEDLKTLRKSNLPTIRRTNIFEKIGNFFKEKYNQYKEWKQRRKENIDNKFSETVDKVGENNEMREDLKKGAPTLEEQRENAKKIMEEAQGRIESRDKGDVNKGDIDKSDVDMTL